MKTLVFSSKIGRIFSGRDYIAKQSPKPNIFRSAAARRYFCLGGSAAARRRSSADSQKPDIFLNFKKNSSEK
jgi:hypothetical protein